MNYIHTKYEHYVKFIEQYKTDRLEKGLKIYTISKSGLFNGNINEIFKDESDTKYNIEKNSTNILISFYTKKQNKYRLDIIRGVEKDKSMDHINHIAFSDYKQNPNDEEKYELLLNRNEMIEIINRIHFILKDLVKNNTINNHFCIGGTKLLAKNNIYQYVLKILVGDNGFDKLDTNVYKTGYGLYFKI